MEDKIETMVELKKEIEKNMKEVKKMMNWIVTVIFFSSLAMSVSFYNILSSNTRWPHLAILLVNSYIISDYACKLIEAIAIYKNYKELKKDFA